MNFFFIQTHQTNWFWSIWHKQAISEVFRVVDMGDVREEGRGWAECWAILRCRQNIIII